MSFIKESFFSQLFSSFSGWTVGTSEVKRCDPLLLTVVGGELCCERTQCSLVRMHELIIRVVKLASMYLVHQTKPDTC